MHQLEWKIKTITNSVKRAMTISTTTTLQHDEIDHLKAVFIKVDENPIKTKNRIVNQELQHPEKSINTVLNNDFTQKV